MAPVFCLGFPGGSDGKESACNVGDLGSIPWLGRFPGGGLSPPPDCKPVRAKQGESLTFTSLPGT